MFEIRAFDESGRKMRTWYTDTVEDVFKHAGDMVQAGATRVEVHQGGRMVMSTSMHVSPWALEEAAV